MKSYKNFLAESENLLRFYKATLFTYEQTSLLIHLWKKDKTSFNTVGVEFNESDYYINRRKDLLKNEKNLSEIVYVRLISALELFLIDLIRDVFIATKEPFKKQDIKLEFTQAELLSLDSPSIIFNKVITKELRKLSSGGFNEIVKYYKRHFGIEFGNFSPGKKKMEEYHDRRHLLVHRLGKTDDQYRKRYNYDHPSITITEEYLQQSFKDFKGFAALINDQIKYKVNQLIYTKNRKPKIVEAKSRVVVMLKQGEQDYLKPSFEFWAGDEFTMLSSLTENRNKTDEKTLELIISGTEKQISSYKKVLQDGAKKGEIKLSRFKTKSNYQEPLKPVYLNEEMLKQIARELPKQPWETGIHKTIASKLGYSNKFVSVAIQLLIGKGIFKNQIDGNIIEPESKKKD
ncbi:hypothetical protein [Leeuwenhoekiella parthenopeia]|uniref:Uncharacterized protein n=1 Tax=Leeuwenhoekiella parthenopeia TaxID=2890320 RepID=A0ABS8GV07_9FLAO|nr:hypothetical protein [Leeuwenhoekiella parthenopeia]MCC4213759.1 hypothetical protein [Leeuwenhoekiella parthenopeia]